jgi:hypothetical protein
VTRRYEELETAERDEARRAEAAAAPPLAAEVLRMQQTAGNQAVGSLLRQVVAPAKPKTDEEIWAEDWADPAFAAARKHFDTNDRPKGTAEYRYGVLCPLYKAHGIDRPLKYVQDNIVWSDFFGHSTPMHKDLKTKLKAAEKKLRDDHKITTAPFGKCWAFNPRTQTNGSWSNHAPGKAIDIDEVTNPRLIATRDVQVISALTGMNISAANPGAAQGLDSYDAGAEASERFQDRYSGQGLADRAAELADEVTDLEAEKKTISDDLGGVPVKGASADDKKKAKELKAKLAAKQAEITAAVNARKTIETEQARFLALDKAVEDLEKAIKQLEGEITALELELDKLEHDQPLEAGGAVATGKDKAKLVKARKGAITTKAAAIKLKQRQLSKAVGARDDDSLRGYAQRGFLDLNKTMVEALKGAGLQWGGDYTGSKDYMHFEDV